MYPFYHQLMVHYCYYHLLYYQYYSDYCYSDLNHLFELYLIEVAYLNYQQQKLTDLEMMCLILMQIQVTLIYVLTFSASKVTSYYYFFTKLSIYKVIKECIDICLLIKNINIFEIFQ